MNSPATAFPGTAILGWVWRELRVALPLCAGVALFLTIAFGGTFSNNLIYSLCIGLTIQFSIEGGRAALAALLRRLDPGRLAVGSHWPGWGLMLPWIVLCAVGGYWLGALLGDWLTGQSHARSLFDHGAQALSAMLLLTLVVSLAATYVHYSRSRLARAQAQAEAARRAAAENQLRLLQSQLEPHMLFNTLANLRVLIGVDPARAQAMLDSLIGYLRATLQASRAERHPLASEFERVADYLALMAVRMGPRLAVTLDLPEALREVPVPPLLLQPLVENAIRHGLEPAVGGGRVTVRARRDGDKLRLTVRDTGAGMDDPPATTGTGFGTLQVRERLAAMYGPRATLDVGPASDAEGGTRAEISLPWPP